MNGVKSLVNVPKPWTGDTETAVSEQSLEFARRHTKQVSTSAERRRRRNESDLTVLREVCRRYAVKTLKTRMASLKSMRCLNRQAGRNKSVDDCFGRVTVTF